MMDEQLRSRKLLKFNYKANTCFIDGTTKANSRMPDMQLAISLHLNVSYLGVSYRNCRLCAVFLEHIWFSRKSIQWNIVCFVRK